MSVNQNFPEVFPSLLLDFANSRTLDPRITFTRSSVGTYVDTDGLIKTAAADEARFDHDPVTGESLGLLIEEQRTNLLTYSENLTSGEGWSNVSQSSMTATNVSEENPGGGSTTTQITGGGVNSWWAKNFTASVSTTYQISLWVKVADGGADFNVGIRFYAPGATSGAIVYGTGFNVTSSWRRVTGYVTSSANFSGSFTRYIVLQLDNTRSFYAWGIQVEAGSFPTSYIPTSGSTETRLQDNASVSNYSIGNITQGTFVFKDFNLRGRNADSTTDPDEIGVFATFSGTNGENRILTDNNYYVSNSSSDTQTITSGQTDRDIITNTPTFTSGVNRIFVSHNVTSTIASQIIWNFTDANGLPTEVGTVLFLEIYSRRYNNGSSGSRGHNSIIKFNGSTILTSGYQAVVAGDTYERAVRKIVILTESGWEEYQNSPSITTGETASYAYSFEYDGTNTITLSAKGGVLSGSASSSGLKLPSDPSLNLNFNPSARTYKKIILYPSALTNAQLQSLTQ